MLAQGFLNNLREAFVEHGRVFGSLRRRCSDRDVKEKPVRRKCRMASYTFQPHRTDP